MFEGGGGGCAGTGTRGGRRGYHDHDSVAIGLIQGCNFLNSEKEETSDAELYK